MKILRIVIENLPHFERELDIDFVAQQRVDDKDREHLYCIFSNIYLKKALSFIGVNASGKTTILKATKLAMDSVGKPSNQPHASPRDTQRYEKGRYCNYNIVLL